MKYRLPHQIDSAVQAALKGTGSHVFHHANGRVAVDMHVESMMRQRRKIWREDGSIAEEVEIRASTVGNHTFMSGRHWDEKGAPLEELFSCLAGKAGREETKITIQRIYVSGELSKETYIDGSRLLSRKSYEKLRASYADMPAATMAIADVGGGMLAAVRKARNQELKEAKALAATTDGDRSDAGDDGFCLARMQEGRAVDGDFLVAGKALLVGERNRTQSLRVLKRLVELQATDLTAVKCDEDEGFVSASYLVVALPTAPDLRTKLFATIHRMMSGTGYAGPVDTAQKYAFITCD